MSARLASILIVAFVVSSTFGTYASADLKDTQQQRWKSRCKAQRTTKVVVKKERCPTRLKLQMQRPPQPPHPRHQEIPLLAKGGIDAARWDEAGLTSLDGSASSFSSMSSLLRVAFCLVRWGSLSPCRAIS